LNSRFLPVNDENALEWVEVKEGDPLSVKWHFTPSIDQTRIFTLIYQVSGVVRKGDMDSIVWMAIPPEHEYRSLASRITIHYPEGAIPVDLPSLTGTYTYQVENGGNPLLITAGPVEADTPLILTIAFQNDSLSMVMPA